MFIRSAYILAVLLLFLSSASGQNFNRYSQNNYSLQKGFDRYVEDLSFITQNTFDPGNYPLWQTLTLTGLTMSFVFGHDIEMHEDYVVKKQFNGLGIPKVLGNIGDIYDTPGPAYFTVGLVSSMYGVGKIIDDKKLIKTTELMIRSLIISSLFTTSLKLIIGRARPYIKTGPHQFNHFNLKTDGRYSSMPSGHTSSIFSMMTVIAKQYNTMWVKVPAYTFAVSVGMQRINEGKHWASDVLLGGVIGYLVGKTIVERSGGGSNSLSIQPGINSKGIGLMIKF